MSDATLLNRWIIGAVAAAVVVVLVAALLLLIIASARGILAAAVRSLAAVQAIRGNVEPIWELGTTNDVAERIAAGARSIEAKAQLLADSVEAHQPTPSGAGA